MTYPPGWPPRTRSAGGWPTRIARLTKQHRPPSPPISAYPAQVTGQIGGYGVGQTTISGAGAGTVTIGPSGLGTIWYPQQAVLSTTTGALDVSTAIGYLGPFTSSPPAQSLLFTSYQAGGDVQGLAVPQLVPGDLITVVWSGGHAGDTATLRIVGTLQALSGNG